MNTEKFEKFSRICSAELADEINKILNVPESEYACAIGFITTKFEKFSRICSKELPNEIDKILNAAKGENVCAVGFITTDDFNGFYLTWNCGSSIDEYFNWENGLEPAFLYQPVVDIVEDCGDIDFCNPSDVKWAFAKTLLSVLEKNIKQIPDEIFRKNGFEREDILFFSTMSAGDYIQKMLAVSVKMFNAPETLKVCGIRETLNKSKVKK